MWWKELWRPLTILAMILIDLLLGRVLWNTYAMGEEIGVSPKPYEFILSGTCVAFCLTLLIIALIYDIKYIVHNKHKR